MEYYQKAAETLRSGEEQPINLLKNAGLTALGAGVATTGSKAISKLIPAIGSLINDYIPDNFSMKGLNKVDPRFSKFIQGAMEEGYSYKDVREFLGDKLKKTESENGIKDTKNIIEKYSPELFSFIDQKIKKGESPLNAGALAQNEKQFSSIIKKLTEDYRTPFSSIIETVFGKEMGRQKALKNFNDKLKKNNVVQEETNRFNQYYGDQQAQQTQVGPGQQALMDILNNINQKLGQ